MKISAFQMDIQWHDRKANHEKAARFAREARDGGADLFILPEMFSTGFSMDTGVTAEPMDGPTPQWMRRLARDLDMAILGGFVLAGQEGEKPQNVSLAVDRKGRDAALYAKIHQIALMEEDRHYRPGEKPALFDMGGFKTACFICYDLRFPELFRSVADECGFSVIIASWPAARREHWEILLRARAVEGQSFVAGVNRVGEGGGHAFAGGTAIIDPRGREMAAGGGAQTLVTADIRMETVAKVRAETPFLKDRKPWLF
ncbi:Carbon-nitrogen hydrolase [Candidatus Desulfarcum epimagneticum]|uniref:Carbon-nitrogen hydrolase n=1 Tax=uncultured Desulfobacteraceae bacterium TaxID=218296 RepID=A0A484HMP0_9BACT|nr:Carbon-nitrogen hydrolase [uncultured Desulfobacteraceae bacterium]